MKTCTFLKPKDIDKQGIPWPLGWLQEIIFRKFGAIQLNEKKKQGSTILLLKN